MNAIELAALAGIGGVFALALLFFLGGYVVKKYPHPHDPDRNRKRYVVPAAILLALAIVGFVVFLVALIVALLGG